MVEMFDEVWLSNLTDELEKSEKFPFPVSLHVVDEFKNLKLHFKSRDVEGAESLLELKFDKDTEGSKIGSVCYIISDNDDDETLHLQFLKESDCQRFCQLINIFRKGRNSVFSIRTDDSSASEYFQFYGYLSQQQNMMQDYVRTLTYQRAILANIEDFKDKVVLDVGAGSGILSFFAAQAGARKVYAVEASSMALHAKTLVSQNRQTHRIVVVPGKIEEVCLPEMVDVIISESMGYMLYNERMLETFLHAKKWLVPNGKMYPTRGDLHVAPFSDATLYMEQSQKANFWQNSFHGVEVDSLHDAALTEYFSQPIVDTFDINICMAKSVCYSVDFESAHESELHKIEIPLAYILHQTGDIHGLAFWFDVAFFGSMKTIWLSTAPTEPLTHWYQVRCLLQNPIFGSVGQTVLGKVTLNANKRQSYDVEIELTIEGSNIISCNSLDLKNPYFRYTGQLMFSSNDSYWLSVEPQSGNDSNLEMHNVVDTLMAG